MSSPVILTELELESSLTLGIFGLPIQIFNSGSPIKFREYFAYLFVVAYEDWLKASPIEILLDICFPNSDSISRVHQSKPVLVFPIKATPPKSPATVKASPILYGKNDAVLD